MGETYKLKNSKGGAFWSLAFRLLRLIVVLNVFAALAYMTVLSNANFATLEAAIVTISLIYYLPKREAERLTLEGGKVIITGREFLFFPYKSSAEYSKVKYKFFKGNDKNKGNRRTGFSLNVGPRESRLVLYKNKRKWIEFTSGVQGWSRIDMADIVKGLISKGCYNWFDFHKKR